MHVCFAGFAIGISAPQATALVTTSPIGDQEGGEWKDSLNEIICWLRGVYGFPCSLVGDETLSSSVQALDDAFRAAGPSQKDVDRIYVEIIDAFEIVDAHHNEIDPPTADHLDALLTEIYLVEGGDPVFLP